VSALVHDLGRDDRVLLLAPHPDDESIATGGLLQVGLTAGAAVRVMYATDGDRNPWAQLAAEGRWPSDDAARARWGALRREEARRALALLGVRTPDITWLGLPDQRLTDMLHAGDARLMDALAQALREWRPTLIVAPVLYDRHPDHSAIAVMLAFVLARAGATAAGVRTLGYRVHAGRHDPEPTRWLALDAGARRRKRDAILCHATQLRWHRETLPAFATEREGYEDVAAPPRPGEPHEVRDAAMDGSTLRVALARGRGVGLGPRVLRVAFLDDAGRMSCAVARLPGRPSTVRLEPGAGAMTATEAVLERDGDGGRLVLELGRAPRACFVKAERPRERALGFFDASGWRPAPAC
jgi:LmbE family N-acetylglucosaminyl deacetylase